MLSAGIIRASNSPWSSPVIVIPKTGGLEHRFCIDYRALNAVTEKDRYPLPHIQDVFDSVGTGKIFSTLDLKSGYHQMPLAPKACPLTAFTCHVGHYEFLRVPFGLAAAPGKFQRTMNAILAPVLGKTALVYIDDIVVYSPDERSHKKHLEQVFGLLREAGVKLKLSKCSFMQRKVDLLGYEISGDGITPLPEKTRAIRDLPVPRNLKAVRSFLGVANYYRQCMPGYAKLAEPLIALTRRNTPYVWSSECACAFQALKDLLVSPAVMAHPDVRRPYKLYTDACNYAVGGILVQVDDQGVERVVQYVSRQLSETQRRWATIEQEAYAVVHCLVKLRPYLYGADFTVYTDHKPLRSLFTKEMNNTKIQRWAILLAEYGAKIEYRKGSENIRADMLSRIEGEAAEREEVLHQVSVITRLQSRELASKKDDVEADPFGSVGIKKSELIEAQRREFEREYAEARDCESEEDYVLLGEVLMSERRPYATAPEYPRVIMPAQWRDTLIDKAHLEVGHMSTAKTVRRLTEAYAWPGMKKDVRNRLKLCSTCLLYHQRPVHVAMQEVEIPKTPMTTIAMDFIGPFTEDPLGNRYVLTIIDYLTGWAEAIMTKGQSASDIIHAISSDFLPRHGHPEVIVCDNGHGFASKEWGDYLSALRIECRHSSAQHPQGNSKCERLNRTLKAILNKMVANAPSIWFEKLAPALQAYRVAVSDVTGFSPYYLLYGRRPYVPLEAFLDRGAPTLGNRLEVMSEAYEAARANLYDSRRYNRERLNARANVKTSLEPGTTVVIKAEERITNTARWDPEYEVIRVQGTTHWLRHQGSGRVLKKHREKLTVVDANIAWDERTPRPKRKFKSRTKAAP